MEKNMNSNVIWTYVYAYGSAGGNMDLRFCMPERRAEFDGDMGLRFFVCFSAGDHMDLRLCTFERRRRYGVTFLHIAAPAVIWTYVSAYGSVAGEADEANVAVARVSCTLGSPRR